MARRIAILGGTGAEGSGLAYRLAKAGEEIVIGSRAASREPMTISSPALARRYASPEPSAPVPPSIAILRAMILRSVPDSAMRPDHTRLRSPWACAASLSQSAVWYLQKLRRCQRRDLLHWNFAKHWAISPLA